MVWQVARTVREKHQAPVSNPCGHCLYSLIAKGMSLLKTHSFLLGWLVYLPVDSYICSKELSHCVWEVRSQDSCPGCHFSYPIHSTLLCFSPNCRSLHLLGLLSETWFWSSGSGLPNASCMGTTWTFSEVESMASRPRSTEGELEEDTACVSTSPATGSDPW